MDAFLLLIGVAFAGSANAQQRAPSAGAMALAKELVELNGAAKMFDPLVSGVIERHKELLIQTNPNLSRDLNEAAQKLHAEMAPRRSEMQNEVVKVYAQHFTEQELKDAVAFYKSPLGRKLISEEPKVNADSIRQADQWASKFAEQIIARLRAELKKKGHNPI